LIGEAVARLLSWAVRKVGWATLLSFALILVLIENLVWVLERNIRGLESSGLAWAAALSLLAGWVFSRSRLRGWQAAVLTAALGLALILARLGRVSGLLFALLGQMNQLAGSLLRWPWIDPPDLSPVVGLLAELVSRMGVPAARFWRWAAGLSSSQVAYDPVATVFLWSILVWGVAAWAAWALRRQARPLPAVLPAGILLAIVSNYTRSDFFFLAPFIAGTLFLSAFTHFHRQERSWVLNGVDYAEDIIFDVGLALAGLTLLVTSFASAAPSISISRFVDFTRSFAGPGSEQPGQVARSIGLNPRPQPKPLFSSVSSPGLPRSHLLDAGRELSEQVVMIVELEAPLPSAGAALPVPDYHWRGLSYDYYTGRGWATSQMEVTEFLAGQPILTPAGPALQEMRQHVRIVENMEPGSEPLLYTAGFPVQADQLTHVARRSHEDLFGVLVARPEYTATSLAIAASEDQLRAAGQDYPQWIRNRYLRLPQEVPDRVLGLGRDLTAPALTPYDQALAIETFLRKIPYSLDISRPPSGRDVSDYFLFDLRRGYCDYYATAMVVLARAAGLPARMVIGYAGGAYDARKNEYLVTEADAHSWVEVYFPGYGWVEFEPTGGRPALARPDQAPDGLPAAGQDSLRPGLPRGTRVDWGRLFGAGVAFAAFLVSGLVLWTFFDAWRLRLRSPAGAIAALYRRVAASGRRLVPLSPSLTPSEFAAALGSQLLAAARQRRLNSILAPAAGEIAQLAGLYAWMSYSPRPLARDDQVRAIRTWRRLRWRLWLARLLKSRV
jgi:transglutaminase-like putative cysteine protease